MTDLDDDVLPMDTTGASVQATKVPADPGAGADPLAGPPLRTGAASIKQELIGILTGGYAPDPTQRAAIDAASAAFGGLSDADPLWMIFLPALLRPGADTGEIRELVADMKSSLKAAQAAPADLAELEEAQGDLKAAVNNLTAKMERSVERGLLAAVASNSDIFSRGGGGIDQKAVADSVAAAVTHHLWPARFATAAGALVVAVALGFIGGTLVHRMTVSRYVGALEAQITLLKAAPVRGTRR